MPWVKFIYYYSVVFLTVNRIYGTTPSAHVQLLIGYFLSLLRSANKHISIMLSACSAVAGVRSTVKSLAETPCGISCAVENGPFVPCNTRVESSRLSIGMLRDLLKALLASVDVSDEEGALTHILKSVLRRILHGNNHYI